MAILVAQIAVPSAPHHGTDSKQLQICKVGSAFEPHVVEKVFRDVLVAEKNITLP